MNNNNSNQQKKEISIEMSPEVAQGKYANLAVISHGPSEFFLDMIFYKHTKKVPLLLLFLLVQWKMKSTKQKKFWHLN